MGDDKDSNYLARCWAVSGAFSGSTKESKTFGNYDGGDTEKAIATVKFDASKNWTGTMGDESAHTHSMSGSVTIGSGDYTRPNSVSTLIIIKY